MTTPSKLAPRLRPHGTTTFESRSRSFRGALMLLLAATCVACTTSGGDGSETAAGSTGSVTGASTDPGSTTGTTPPPAGSTGSSSADSSTGFVRPTCDDGVDLGSSVGTVYAGTVQDGSNEQHWGEDCGWSDGNELLFHWSPPEPGSYRVEVVPSGPSSMRLDQFDDSCWVFFDCETGGGCTLEGIGMNILVFDNDEDWNFVLEGIDTDFDLEIVLDERIPCEGGTGTGTGTGTGSGISGRGTSARSACCLVDASWGPEFGSISGV